MIRYDQEHGIFIPDTFLEYGIEAAFSSRTALLLYDSISAKQVHGTNLVLIDDKRPQPTEADGLFTHRKGLRISVRTADCVPILYADIRLNIIAASHQGWKGTLQGLAPSVIRQFIHQGSNIHDIRIAIGPAIGACCYCMYGERMDLFTRHYPQFVTFCTRSGEDTTYFDLARLNYLQLSAMGIPPSHIDRGVYCTACDDHRLFSYQRDGSGCGHMISYIMMKEEQP